MVYGTKINKLNIEPVHFKYDNEGRVTHMKLVNIQGGGRCSIDLEYDNNGRVIKSMDNNHINPTTTTYEYDEYNRLVRAVDSRYGYHDIVATYEYDNNCVTKTVNHSDYKSITKTNENMDIICHMYDYLNGTIFEDIFDFDYDKKSLKHRKIYKKDGIIISDDEIIKNIEE